VLVNTTHRVLFDMAKSEPDAFYWRDQRGTLDYYVIAGGDFKTLLRAYTDLTGKPKLPPLWAFGLWYLFRDEANDWEVIQSAERFRGEGIPCDVLGLEPGWMATNYDLTPDKKWHPGRFPMPPWKKPMLRACSPACSRTWGSNSNFGSATTTTCPTRRSGASAPRWTLTQQRTEHPHSIPRGSRTPGWPPAPPPDEPTSSPVPPSPGSST